MSDPNSLHDESVEPQREAASTDVSSVPQSHRSTATTIRQVVLVVLLLVMAGALAYDRLVARPAPDKAREALGELLAQKEKAVGQLTREEVIDTLGQPTEMDHREGSRYKMDTYRWRAGIPWRSYTINVIYSGVGDNLFYEEDFLNQLPPPEKRPGYEPPVPKTDGPPAGPQAIGSDAGDNQQQPGPTDGSSQSDNSETNPFPSPERRAPGAESDADAPARPEDAETGSPPQDRAPQDRD